jgi:hypothetical protein
MWRWLRNAGDKILPAEPDLTQDKEEASKYRERTEKALLNDSDRTDEVMRVAAASRRIRTRNNFAERITESFRGQGRNGTTAR